VDRLGVRPRQGLTCASGGFFRKNRGAFSFATPGGRVLLGGWPPAVRMIPLLRFLLRLVFRLRIEGAETLAGPGPMVLCPNHTSWLDWAFVLVCLGDDWKFVASSTTAQATWIHRKMMINSRTFPVDNTSSFAVRGMAEHLEKGGKLVLFPEGRISNTTQLMRIYDGTAFLVHRTGAKVVTCYLRNAVRVKWVRHKGWTQWFPRVSVHFSAPLTAPDTSALAHNVARQKLTQWLRDQMMLQQFETEMRHGPATLPAAIRATARVMPNKIALEDITFTELTYARLMVVTDVLAGALARHLSAERGERIGVMLPTVNGAVTTVLALWARGKTPAFLNYSTGAAVMLSCAQLAGLKQVLTSRAFLEKAKLNLQPLHDAGIQFIYLEDVRSEVSAGAKFTAALRQTFSFGHALKNAPVTATDTAAVIFTSGSEGVPKGVELTHRGMLADLRQIFVAADLRDDDRFFNALPFFHSFGLVGGIVAPLVRGCYVFNYPSPLHYRIVPTVVYEKNCTILLGTNTFLNGYARKAHPYDLQTVRYLVAGAEKVQAATLDTYARKFGVRIHEGYGATECGPVVCINTKMDPRTETAGRLLPGVQYRLEPVAGVAEGGQLFVKTPAMMKGYLNPDANAKFQALGGWYDTGDIAKVDDDGYVTVLGRLKRFAKVSGEMISLTAVEDALAGAFTAQFGLRCTIAIVAVPDAEKGERLVALANEPRLQLTDVRAAVRAKGLSNLCAPRELRFVHAIPKLGSGKTDYRELQRMLRDSETTVPSAAGVA
jgi:acyl-[acyl-carrier-protein]-phospholipid O-acyltransferase/long-chain-fatty-acid--[acyl-carrier-protein] ligase